LCEAKNLRYSPADAFHRDAAIGSAIGIEAAFFSSGMRLIKLTGREASVVRAIGFTESMLGTEIQDYVRMESEDVTDTLNSLMAAGFVESIPYAEQVQLAEMPVTAFEINPAYSHQLKEALIRS
jgi:hypothetical protein